MAPKEHSFDISAKVEIQEIKNALEQTKKEITNRYDFKDDTTKSISLNEKEKTITLIAATPNKANAIKDIFQSKLIKRNINIKCLKELSKQTGPKEHKICYSIHDTLDDASIKSLIQEIKSQKFKIQSQIQGSEIRIKSKDIDELQKVIAHLKGLDTDFQLGFYNFQ